jgi:hypothetical protein
MTVPTFLDNKSVVVVKTQNGYAIAPDKDSRIEECVSFDTWADAQYYLATNFAHA